LTAKFLINRLPTPILQNESPFFKLFGKQPDYSFLKSFGCLYYPLLRPYAAHKLSFRSKPCIFLGYATNHYGYRCFEPQSGRIYVSRHVVFYESKFPAKRISLSQGPCTVTNTPGSGSSLIFPPKAPTVTTSTTPSQVILTELPSHFSPPLHIATSPTHTNESPPTSTTPTSNSHESHLSPSNLNLLPPMSPTRTNISSPPHQHAVTAPLPINVLPTMSPTHTTTSSPPNPHAATTPLPPFQPYDHSIPNPTCCHLITNPTYCHITLQPHGHPVSNRPPQSKTLP
jgi:hypothetical protein